MTPKPGPGCPLKLLCTLTECILWLWRQERWQVENPQIQQREHGLWLPNGGQSFLELQHMSRVHFSGLP